jgi:dolichol kinase
MGEAPPEPAPSDLERLAARFAALWNYPFLGSWLIRLALLAVLASFCLVRTYIGLSGITVYSHDAFGALDGAWRVLNGQTPHADFYTPLGPLIYLVTAFGLLLSHGGAEGAGYSQALCGGLLGLWTYRLARHRLGHLPTILLCLSVVLLSINPSSVGEPPIRTSCMAYNRYGYALVALLLLEGVAGRDPERRRAEFWGGFSTGAILALLLFLKISYFVGGAALVAAVIPCRKQVKERWAGMIGGFLPVALIFYAYLGFNLVPMWNDLRMVAGAKSARMTWFIVDNLYLPVAFYLGFIFASIRFLWFGGARPAARAMGVAGVAVCLAGIFLLSTNFQFYGLPLNAMAALLVLQQIAGHPPAANSHKLKQAGLLLWGSLLVAGDLGYEALGLGFGAWQRHSWEETANASFHAATLAGFRTFEASYVDLVNDGLALVSQHRRPDDTVMSLDFSNPFPYALGMRPAPGGATTLHYRGNFSDSHHPTPERLFGGASLVMIPVVPTEKGLARSVPRIYGPYLKQHFHPIGESTGWRLYRRNAEAAGGHAL